MQSTFSRNFRFGTPLLNRAFLAFFGLLLLLRWPFLTFSLFLVLYAYPFSSLAFLSVPLFPFFRQILLTYINDQIQSVAFILNRLFEETLV